MIKVALNDIRIFAYHGFYPEEQILGNNFLLDIAVEFDPTDRDLADNLERTVNYEILYKIVQQEMKKTRSLLETVAQSITDEILKTYPFVFHICTKIKKLNPPMPGQIAYSLIEITYTRN
jgi:dihydroneopterin aldolase